MNTAARQPPRFVPTLTERVDPLELDRLTAHPDAAVEALVKEVWQQIQPMLAQRLQEHSEQWLRTALAQHLRDINAQLQSDMELLVHQAVMDALKTQTRPGPTAAPVNSRV
jgi:DNA polymerase III delta subunit